MRSAFERYRVDAAYHRQLDGARLRPSLASVARGTAYEVREDWRHLVRNRRAASWHLVRSPGLRGARVLGQYFGSRGWSWSTHRASSRPPPVFEGLISAVHR